MEIKFTASMVRGLKGAPISVLVLLALQNQPVGQEYLQRMSGYSDKIVESALLTLLEFGYVVRLARFEWRIAGPLSQLPLMPDLPETVDSSDESDTTGTRRNSESEKFRVDEEKVIDIAGSRNNSESEKFRVDQEIMTDSEGTRKNSVSETEKIRVDCSSSSRYIYSLTKELKLLLLDLEESEKIRVVQNLQACDEYGITDPAKTKISLLKTTTPELIQYHVENLKDSDTLGAAIFRIEKNWRINQKWLKDHDRNKGRQPLDSETWEQYYADSELSQEPFLKILEVIKPDYRRSDFETWLKTLQLVEVKENEWTLRAINPFAGKWVVDHHALEKMESVSGIKIRILCNGTEIK